ncbi:hypothetical protein FACS1894187_22660 [Synergistales bacterium]|nr:hypothetical protein FACS1894187_22660 [Synergistales bacterium]
MSEIFAIDFGTTHTHCSAGQTDSPNMESASIEPGRNGTSTVLLFKNGKYCIYGNMALEEYANIVDQNDAQYDLYVNFKPDIEHNPDAAEKAKCFLEKTADTLKMGKDTQIIVGVPAGSDEGYRTTLKTLMKDRFGDVETISEPLGALCHFLTKNTLSTSDVLYDVLVIDFGGGTCDFAYSRNGKTIDIKLKEGFHFGGRLFDDLFFQWWEAKNPEKAAECPEDIKNLLLMLTLREAKERFST